MAPRISGLATPDLVKDCCKFPPGRFIFDKEDDDGASGLVFARWLDGKEILRCFVSLGLLNGSVFAATCERMVFFCTSLFKLLLSAAVVNCDVELLIDLGQGVTPIACRFHCCCDDGGSSLILLVDGKEIDVRGLAVGSKGDDDWTDEEDSRAGSAGCTRDDDDDGDGDGDGDFETNALPLSIPFPGIAYSSHSGNCSREGRTSACVHKGLPLPEVAVRKRRFSRVFAQVWLGDKDM